MWNSGVNPELCRNCNLPLVVSQTRFHVDIPEQEFVKNYLPPAEDIVI